MCKMNFIIDVNFNIQQILPVNNYPPITAGRKLVTRYMNASTYMKEYFKLLLIKQHCLQIHFTRMQQLTSML